MQRRLFLLEHYANAFGDDEPSSCASVTELENWLIELDKKRDQIRERISMMKLNEN